MYYRCNSTVKQHIQFFLGGDSSNSKMYGGTTVLFHDDNGPPRNWRGTTVGYLGGLLS